MLKEGQKIEVRWSPQTYKYYQALGYDIKHGEIIYIDPIELPENSHNKITAICDNCGKEITTQYRYYIKNVKNNNKFLCATCLCERKEVNDMRVIKIKNTLKTKYGVEYPVYIPGVLEKMQETNMNRYGVKWTTQSEQMKTKSKMTMSQNGSVRTSKPQIEVFNILKKTFNNVSINKNFDYYSLDCELIVDNIKIDIEYDGAFWHQNKSHDNKRDGYLKKNGYKILRIKSGSKIPSEQELIEKISILIETDLKYTEIILQDWTDFTTKQNT